MCIIFFDASALVKRYTEDIGSDKIDFLFQNVPSNRLMCLAIGVAEVFSICVKKEMTVELRDITLSRLSTTWTMKLSISNRILKRYQQRTG